MKLDGEYIVFAEISGSEVSQGLLELLSSSAKAVNSFPSLQEIKSQNVHNLATEWFLNPGRRPGWENLHITACWPGHVPCQRLIQLWCKCDSARWWRGIVSYAGSLLPLSRTCHTQTVTPVCVHNDSCWDQFASHLVTQPHGQALLSPSGERLQAILMELKT